MGTITEYKCLDCKNQWKHFIGKGMMVNYATNSKANSGAVDRDCNCTDEVQCPKCRSKHFSFGEKIEWWD